MKWSVFIASTIITAATFNVSSPDFNDRDFIPKKCSCQGANVNPSLEIENLSAEAKSIVLVMDDPDMLDKHENYIHWMVWDIPPTSKIKPNNTLGISGKNSMGKYGYTGPCPTSGVHRYYITVYSLNTLLNLDRSVSRKTLEKAMKEHIIAKTELMGYYEKTEAFLIVY